MHEQQPGKGRERWEPLRCWELEESLLDPPTETARPLPSRRLSVPSAWRWQLNHICLELDSEAPSMCLLPHWIFHLHCHQICRYPPPPAPVSSSVLPAETSGELLSREGSFIRLLHEGCSNLQARSLAVSKSRNPAIHKGCTVLQAQQGPAVCLRLQHVGDGSSVWYLPAHCPSALLAFT